MTRFIVKHEQCLHNLEAFSQTKLPNRNILLQKLRALVNPTIDWGPALVEHRKLVDYVDGWVVDPNNPTDMQLGSFSVRFLPETLLKLRY